MKPDWHPNKCYMCVLIWKIMLSNTWRLSNRLTWVSGQRAGETRCWVHSPLCCKKEPLPLTGLQLCYWPKPRKYSWWDLYFKCFWICKQSCSLNLTHSFFVCLIAVAFPGVILSVALNVISFKSLSAKEGTDIIPSILRRKLGQRKTDLPKVIHKIKLVLDSKV